MNCGMIQTSPYIYIHTPDLCPKYMYEVYSNSLVPSIESHNLRHSCIVKNFEGIKIVIEKFKLSQDKAALKLFVQNQ